MLKFCALPSRPVEGGQKITFDFIDPLKHHARLNALAHR